VTRVLVVSGTGTGVGNTAVTAALAARKLAAAGVVIGSWPRQPGIAEPSISAAAAPAD
jgi:dethiobiotin synthetase